MTKVASCYRQGWLTESIRDCHSNTEIIRFQGGKILRDVQVDILKTSESRTLSHFTRPRFDVVVRWTFWLLFVGFVSLLPHVVDNQQADTRDHEIEPAGGFKIEKRWARNRFLSVWMARDGWPRGSRAR